MKIGLLSFLCATLLLAGCTNGEQNGVDNGEPTRTAEPTPLPSPAETPAGPEDQPETFILSDEQPEIRLPVAPQTLEANPEILEITITEIRNESLIPFSIFVYLEWITNGATTEPVGSVLVAAFSVFPPDQPGRYTLRVTNALRYLRSTLDEGTPAEVSLHLQLRPVSDTTSLVGVEAQLAPPEWTQ